MQNDERTVKFFSRVFLHEDIGGVFRNQDAVAIWYEDDTIGVYSIDAITNTYIAKYFECSVKDISWAMASLAALTFNIGKKNYSIDFNPAAFKTFMATSALGVGNDSVVLDAASLAGGLFSDNMTHSSDIDIWLASLKSAGVKIDTMLRNPGAFGIKWGLIISAGLIGLIIVSFVIYLLFEY